MLNPFIRPFFIFIVFTVQLITPFCWSDHNSESNDFYVLTIPKSGSHLILKMLNMLTNKTYVPAAFTFPNLHGFTFGDESPNAFIPEKELEDTFAFWKQSNCFALAHFNFAESFYNFSLKHPEYVKIIQIRDLRDVCVSSAFFNSNEIENEIGPCSFDEKLMFVINLGNKPLKNQIHRIEKNARIAAKWSKDPTVIVSRFEDLVGTQGGGNSDIQKNQIIKIANCLNIPLDPLKLQLIAYNLFGKEKGPKLSVTFREGKTGSWKKYFKEEHKEAFIQTMGDVQTQLGYPLFDEVEF